VPWPREIAVELPPLLLTCTGRFGVELPVAGNKVTDWAAVWIDYRVGGLTVGAYRRSASHWSSVAEPTRS